VKGISGSRIVCGTGISRRDAHFSTTIVVTMVNFRVENAKYRFSGCATIRSFEGAVKLEFEMARHLTLGLVPFALVALATSTYADEANPERNVAAFTPGTVISVGQDIVVGVISRGTSAGDGVIKDVVLDLEAISPSLQSVMGGKSARVVINADCQSRRIATQSMQIFERPNATGGAKPKAVITDWTAAPAGSYGADVLDLYCKPAALASLMGTPKGAASGETRSVSNAAPAPQVAKSSVSMASTRSTPAPAARNEAPSKPALMMTAVVAPTSRMDGNSARQGAFGVQFFSSVSSREAQTTLARLKSTYHFWPTGRNGFVSQAEVNGTSRYRARLGGFSGLTEAKSFCEKVAAAGGQCIVVKDPS